MSEPLLRIEDVGVTYGKGATALSALRDISLDVRSG